MVSNYLHFYFRQEHIAKQMARMPQLVEQFRQKLQKKETARADQEKKKESLLEEAREYYGYPISYYDPRIEELKAKKEEEQKKLAKVRFTIWFVIKCGGYFCAKF